ncbi:hypothetical protein [Saccharothrix violaceirubra]|uniref:Tetratricopeptide repeat protein n=1 Tax=Saccharothrix violaceirubra TaxID=413306 RepID=A0A7W7T164_9PSEU|nr:hypothetical protein [Saccharothrix violaceirubra]MBB4964391.1 hypothetical protein [Saccharothrix violaceirubra]
MRSDSGRRFDRRDERSRDRAARFQERAASTDQTETGAEVEPDDVDPVIAKQVAEATGEVPESVGRAGDDVAGEDDLEDDLEDDEDEADSDDDESVVGERDDDVEDDEDETDEDGDRRSADVGAESPAEGGRDGRRDGDGGRTRAPELPEEADISLLDPEIRQELRGLPKGLADIVGRHLAAAGLLIDGEPEVALEHARYARLKAARVGVVREAAGLTAYYAGEWAEALSELRAARRMTHGSGNLAIMADCERALGRPERAIELARDAQGLKLDPEEAVELRIVVAGARRDMGQHDAAVVALQGPDLDEKRRDPWSARLFYAYADNLEAAGRTEEAVRWFLNAAQADDDNETDAAERAFDLSPQE